MKLRRILTSFAFMISLSAPMALNSVASAAVAIDLNRCNFNSNSQIPCDLAVKKEVSVNGGVFVDANDVANAANAQVGDTITWRITVTNTLPTTMPEGDVDVFDVIPAGVSFVSATPSTGTFASNKWNFSVGNVVGEGYINYLPAELTIVTTANTTGVISNLATLDAYYCDGPCEYEDGNTTNNADVAFVNIQVKPQVLGESTTTPQVLAATTLAATGSSSLAPSAISLLLIATTVGLAYVTRRKSGFSIKS